MLFAYRQRHPLRGARRSMHHPCGKTLLSFYKCCSAAHAMQGSSFACRVPMRLHEFVQPVLTASKVAAITDSLLSDLQPHPLAARQPQTSSTAAAA